MLAMTPRECHCEGTEFRSNLIYKEWVASPQLAATGKKDNLRITIKRS